MFANSVISRSSISIFSLLLSSLPPPPSLSLSLTFCLYSFLLVYVLPTRFFLSSGFARAASAIYEQVVVMRCRVTSGLSAIVPSLSLSLSLPQPTVRPSLSPTSSPAAPFIHLPCGSSVSVSSTPLHRSVRRIRVTRHRSKCLVLCPPLSLSLVIWQNEPLCRTNPVAFIPSLSPSK